jgi:hypothetical protein
MEGKREEGRLSYSEEKGAVLDHVGNGMHGPEFVCLGPKLFF